MKNFYSLLVIIITGILHSVILRIIHHKVKDVKDKYYWGNVVRYTTSILAFIIVAGI